LEQDHQIPSPFQYTQRLLIAVVLLGSSMEAPIEPAARAFRRAFFWG
jgi:hypothetical protein